MGSLHVLVGTMNAIPLQYKGFGATYAPLQMTRILHTAAIITA